MGTPAETSVAELSAENHKVFAVNFAFKGVEPRAKNIPFTGLHLIQTHDGETLIAQFVGSGSLERRFNHAFDRFSASCFSPCT